MNREEILRESADRREAMPYYSNNQLWILLIYAVVNAVDRIVAAIKEG